MPVADWAQDGQFPAELGLSLHALRVQLLNRHRHPQHLAAVYLPKPAFPNNASGGEVVCGLHHLRARVGLQVRKLWRVFLSKSQKQTYLSNKPCTQKHALRTKTMHCAARDFRVWNCGRKTIRVSRIDSAARHLRNKPLIPNANSNESNSIFSNQNKLVVQHQITHSMPHCTPWTLKPCTYRTPAFQIHMRYHSIGIGDDVPNSRTKLSFLVPIEVKAVKPSQTNTA